MKRNLLLAVAAAAFLLSFQSASDASKPPLGQAISDVIPNDELRAAIPVKTEEKPAPPPPADVIAVDIPDELQLNLPRSVLAVRLSGPESLRLGELGVVTEQVENKTSFAIAPVVQTWEELLSKSDVNSFLVGEQGHSIKVQRNVNSIKYYRAIPDDNLIPGIRITTPIQQCDFKLPAQLLLPSGEVFPMKSVISHGKPWADFKGVRDALIKNGATKEIATKQVADVQQTLAALSDEELRVAALGADSNALRTTIDPTEATRIALLFLIDNWNEKESSSCSKFKSGDNSIYICQTSKNRLLFRAEAFGKAGAVVWQCWMIGSNGSDRKKMLDEFFSIIP